MAFPSNVVVRKFPYEVRVRGKLSRMFSGASGPTMRRAAACGAIWACTRFVGAQEDQRWSRADVSRHDSAENGGVWITYKNNVYDVTSFLHLHPGITAAATCTTVVASSLMLPPLPLLLLPCGSLCHCYDVLRPPRRIQQHHAGCWSRCRR